MAILMTTALISMNMVKSHLLSRSTLSSAIIGVVPKEDGTNEGKDEDRTCMHAVGTAGNFCTNCESDR